ncbi:hypothetical protein K525DRAFT_248646 [Schizophyllum commune Loenen D]|nr:hypothetical protein K525DRAFT_248646 [Schizophyllum commune Loenen D]
MDMHVARELVSLPDHHPKFNQLCEYTYDFTSPSCPSPTMSSEEPTLDTLKEYKEGVITAANARDKAALLGVLRKVDDYKKPPEALGPSLLGLTVGKLRYHETEEGLRRSGSNVTRRLSEKRAASSRQPSNATREKISAMIVLTSRPQLPGADVVYSAAAYSDAAPKENMGPSTEPVSRGRTLARDNQGKKKALAFTFLSGRSASHGMSARSAPNIMPVDGASSAKHVDRTHSSGTPTRSFAMNDLGDASTLRDAPLRALTIELVFYDALFSGAGDMLGNDVGAAAGLAFLDHMPALRIVRVKDGVLAPWSLVCAVRLLEVAVRKTGIEVFELRVAIWSADADSYRRKEIHLDHWKEVDSRLAALREESSLRRIDFVAVPDEEASQADANRLQNWVEYALPKFAAGERDILRFSAIDGGMPWDESTAWDRGTMWADTD